MKPIAASALPNSARALGSGMGGGEVVLTGTVVTTSVMAELFAILSSMVPVVGHVVSGGLINGPEHVARARYTVPTGTVVLSVKYGSVELPKVTDPKSA